MLQFYAMNELLFCIQILLIVGFALGALKLGRAALTGWVVILALIANLFVIKQITLAGFHVTASDTFMIGSVLGLNFLQEYFGKEEARQATWITFFFMLFFVLVSQIHLLYEPSPYDTTQTSFQTILSIAPRLFIASMTVFFIVQQFDIAFFAFLKNRFPHRSFALRTTVSLVLSQFLDTLLFSFAGLYGIVGSLLDIIFVSFCVKLVAIFLISPFMRWAKT